MKTVCIYHSIDLDGWMSAAIVKLWHNQQRYCSVSGQPLPKDYAGSTPMGGLTLSEDCTFIGYNYGQPIPDLSEYDKVIMCDISFPKKEMLKLANKLGCNFVWIDHHQPKIEEISKYLGENYAPTIDGLTTIEGRPKYAACELTWQHFFHNESIPEIVRLLGRYDCFGHKTKSFEMSNDGYDKAKQYLKEVGQLKEFEDNHTSIDGYSLVHYANDVAKLLSEEQKVLEFQYGARQCIANYEEAYDYLLRSITDLEIINTGGLNAITSWFEIWKNGKSIYQYLCKEAKQVYKTGFRIRFTEEITDDIGKNIVDRRFLCINRERFNPINFGIDYHKDGYDGVVSFHYDGSAKLWRYSLYNDNGKVDCSAIAKQFGGGGHKRAAGFTSSTTL